MKQRNKEDINQTDINLMSRDMSDLMRTKMKISIGMATIINLNYL